MKYTDIEEANIQIELLVEEKDSVIEHYQNNTCGICGHGEPVLCNTKIWCRSPDTHFGNIRGIALNKDFGCNKFKKKD